jgi:hypothetical protein
MSLAISRREINGHKVPSTCTTNSFLVLYECNYPLSLPRTVILPRLKMEAKFCDNNCPRKQKAKPQQVRFLLTF